MIHPSRSRFQIEALVTARQLTSGDVKIAARSITAPGYYVYWLHNPSLHPSSKS